jgi:hypothetical protein
LPSFVGFRVGRAGPGRDRSAGSRSSSAPGRGGLLAWVRPSVVSAACRPAAFADVLHARLGANGPDRVPRLHQRAREWFASHGLAEDAVRHALAAADIDRAAHLMEEAPGPILSVQGAFPVEVEVGEPCLLDGVIDPVSVPGCHCVCDAGERARILRDGGADLGRSAPGSQGSELVTEGPPRGSSTLVERVRFG